MSRLSYVVFRARIVLHITLRGIILGLEHTVVPLLLIGSVCFLVFVLLRVGDWLAVAKTIDPAINPNGRIVAENEIMRTLAQVFGGALVLVGIYFTAKNVFLSRQGQTNERFADAIEKLGDNKSLPRRLGAIHVLESVAQESSRDHWRVMELFTYYIRHFSRSSDSVENGSQDAPSLNTDHPAPDIQQMLSAIGRRRRVLGLGESQPLDFTGADLRGADLRGANLEGANFSGANLEGVIFQSALLRKARFARARLDRANLNLADLRDANFHRAIVREVQCRQAILDRTAFTWCDMAGSSFEATVLLEVDFARANLDRVDFTGSRLLNCILHNTNIQVAKLDHAIIEPPLGRSEEQHAIVNGE
jgi:hypothetical protein